jgi:RimJ/RimL family protein N-acetyltransferase
MRLWQGTDAQFLICGRDSGDRLGLVQLHDYMHRDGTAQLSAFVDPSVEGAGWPFEGIVMFINYCFEAWPLRKLYLESPAPVYERYNSGLDQFFTIEGRLIEHEFFGGAFVDRVISAVHRSIWIQFRPLIQRFVNPSSAGSGGL